MTMEHKMIQSSHHEQHRSKKNQRYRSCCCRNHRAASTILCWLLAVAWNCSFLTVASDGGPGPRIVGGNNVGPDVYGFFASWDGSCGATVIHDDILLTAAHCNPLGSTNIIINAYGRDPKNNNVPIGTATRVIEERILHPDYNKDTWEFDILLLKLSEPVPAGTPFVTLNSNGAEPNAGDTVTAVGLGRTAEEDGVLATTLQEVDVQAIDTNACRKNYPGWIEGESMVCAGIPNIGQKDACYGDSGGPLLQDVNGDGNIVQVGIVSFGTGCARANKPGVYSRVSAAHNWIQLAICFYSAIPAPHCSGYNAGTAPATSSPTTLPTLSPTPLATLPALFTYPDNPPIAANLPLGECQGDCDSDVDCGEGLFCYQRTGGDATPVPGCNGADLSDTDFCVSVVYLTADAKSVAETSPRPSAPPTMSTVPSDVPSMSPSTSPTTSFLRGTGTNGDVTIASASGKLLPSAMVGLYDP